jgi:hypothetical protein
MYKNSYKENLGLFLLAATALTGFILSVGKIYPHKAANMKIDRGQAVEIAKDLMTDNGYDLKDYHVSAVMQHDSEAFVYLQKKFGLNTAEQMSKYKANHGFDYYWIIYWFKNLPRNAPQERFKVNISGDGNIVGFVHEIPQTKDWPRPERAHLTQDEAHFIALEFLEYEEVNLSVFQKGLFTTMKHEKRTDHIFSYRDVSKFDDSYAELIVGVWGDEIGYFTTSFHLPDDAATEIKQQRGNEFFFDRVISITTLFFIGLILLTIFLKKYHEGEVEVRTGGIVFLVLWLVFIVQAVLKFRITAYGFSLEELSHDGVALFIFIIMVLIIRPFLSIFGFTAWSVSESLGRQKFNHKFSAIDGVLNGHVSTFHFAQSAFRGYCAGFITLGLIGSLFWVGLNYFNCTTNINGYETVVPVTFNFLIPVIIASSGSILSEMVFRLFGNLVLFRYLKSKLLAVLISAAVWSFYVPGFWGLQISIYPITYELMVWFIIGLFFGFLFWKYDILTVIFANFVTMGVMQTLPLITSEADSMFRSGLISLTLLSIPLIFMVIGFIKKKSFKYKGELIPAHIKRITERVRMSRELEIARQVQMRLLPKQSPVVPGFEISGACIPAKEVGGDYFDFIELGGSRLGIVIGDVSGKGVPAAIYMTLTKGIVQSHADNFISPVDVLTRVNDLLYKTIDRDSFVSLFYAVLDFEKKMIIYSRAGHNPVLYYNRRKNVCKLLEPEGIALGLEKGELFRKVICENEIKIGKGDLLVFYTDGFTEARDKHKNEYGEKRLIDVIQKYHDKSVQKIYEAVIADLKQFVKDTPQHDDMTAIFIKGK